LSSWKCASAVFPETTNHIVRISIQKNVFIPDSGIFDQYQVPPAGQLTSRSLVSFPVSGRGGEASIGGCPRMAFRSLRLSAQTLHHTQKIILGISTICLWLFFQVFLDFEQNCYPRTASYETRVRIFIGGSGKTFWYDWSSGRICRAKGERIAKVNNYF